MINQFQPYNLETLGWTRLPNPPITMEDREKAGLSHDATPLQLLRKLCYLGFEEKLLSGKIPKEKHQEYTDRCKLEIDSLEELHFIDYILLVWKTIDKARQLGVFIDYGRGSCASSIVFWLLKITGCDPIKYGLFFSRFISKTRAKSKIINGELWLQTDLIPDADLNLGEGRDEIVAWLKNIYPNRVSKIANISTLTGKILVKDVYKVVDEVNEEEAKSISDLVERRFGTVQDLEDVYRENSLFKVWADNHPDTYQICLSLKNLNRQYSTHASGYLISNDEITNHSPLFLDSEKEITCAYTMENVQCIKLDLLGLDTNRIIKTVLSLTGENVDTINLDNDSIIYNQFQHGNLKRFGLYQISSDCAYRIVNEVKPKNILELSDVNALARPGSLAWVKDYIKGDKKLPHPLFETALKATRNLPLYQETLMQMLMIVGFSADDAETCRKIIGKKQLNKVGEWKQKIYDQIAKNGFDKEIGDLLWKILSESASYSFNKCLHPNSLVITGAALKTLNDIEIGDSILALDIKTKQNNYVTVLDKIIGEEDLYEIELENGYKIRSSMNHKFLSENMEMVPLHDIVQNGTKIIIDNTQEYFEHIPGFEDRYMVSNRGNIVSLGKISSHSNLKILKAYTDQDGYLRLSLRKNGTKRKYYVHRLVALAFLSNPHNKPTINHKNGIKNDNRVENLEWATWSENNQHAYDTNLNNSLHCCGEKAHNSKLTEKDVLEIKRQYKSGDYTQTELAIRYNVIHQTISAIIRGKTWKYLNVCKA